MPQYPGRPVRRERVVRVRRQMGPGEGAEAEMDDADARVARS